MNNHFCISQFTRKNNEIICGVHLYIMRFVELPKKSSTRKGAEIVDYLQSKVLFIPRNKRVHSLHFMLYNLILQEGVLIQEKWHYTVGRI